MNNLQAAAAALKSQAIPAQVETIPVIPPVQNNPTPAPWTYGGKEWGEVKRNKVLLQTALKAERQAQCLTQRELARRSGMSQGTVTRAENSGWVSYTCLLRLAQALGKQITLS